MSNNFRNVCQDMLKFPCHCSTTVRFFLMFSHHSEVLTGLTQNCLVSASFKSFSPGKQLHYLTNQTACFNLHYEPQLSAKLRQSLQPSSYLKIIHFSCSNVRVPAFTRDWFCFQSLLTRTTFSFCHGFIAFFFRYHVNARLKQYRFVPFSSFTTIV